jgi:hypothetical protein
MGRRGLSTHRGFARDISATRHLKQNECSFCLAQRCGGFKMVNGRTTPPWLTKRERAWSALHNTMQRVSLNLKCRVIPDGELRFSGGADPGSSAQWREASKYIGPAAHLVPDP